MKTSIVADGEFRLHRSDKHRARLQILRATIRARHATEEAQANFFGRLVLYWRMTVEYRKERRKIEPSKQSLYGNHP